MLKERTRIKEIISCIYMNPKKKVEYYAGKLNISKRTLYNELKIIEDIISESGAELVKNKGLYSIKVTNNDLFNEKYNNSILEKNFFDLENPKKRLLYISYLLITQNTEVDMFKLAGSLNVSEPTIRKDLTLIKKQITRYNCDVLVKDFKIYIDGKFQDRMNYLFNCIWNYNNQIELFYKDIYFDKNSIKKLLINYFRNNNIHIFEVSIEQFLLNISLLLNCNLEELDLDVGYKDCIYNSKVNEMIFLLENHCGFNFNKNVRIMIKNSVSKFCIIPSYENNLQSKTKEYQYEFINYIHNTYKIYIGKDKKFIQDTYKHIYSMIDRYEKGVSINDTITKQIKRYFPFPYEITLDAVVNLGERFDLHFNNEEVCFLALHVGAVLQRIYSEDKTSNLKIALVMDESYSYVLLMKYKLNSILCKYNLNIEDEYTLVDYDHSNSKYYDVIVTNKPLNDQTQNIIVNNLSLDNHNIDNLVKTIHSSCELGSNTLEKYFDKRLFKRGNYRDKFEVIDSIAEILENIKAVNSDFKESLLKRECIGATNLNEFVAIPHPLGLIANESKIATIVLDKPIQWTDNSTVEIIFLLAISERDVNDMACIYELLVDLVSAENILLIKKCKNYSEFLELIQNIAN